MPYPRHPDSRPFAPGLPAGPYVFVQAADGVVWVLPETTGHLHPVVLGNAEPAAAAGGLLIDEVGVIVQLENFSGTFRFGPEILPQVRATLEAQGGTVAPARRWPMGTTNGSPNAVTVTATRADYPDRWVRLTLSLRSPGGALGGLSHAASFAAEVEPRDDLTATYDLENWESGLLSGYYFACRRARQMPPPPLRVSELAGSLASEDMAGVAHAAAVAAAHLFGYDPGQVSTPGWTVTAHAAPAAATA